MIRVCIVEDQALVRQGLRSMLALAPDMQVVAEAENGQQALELICICEPTVLLLDYRMPQLDGLGVLRALQEQNGKAPPVLLLTTFDDEQLLLDSVQAGAKGYLLKDTTLDNLLSAIRAVASGGRWLQPVTPPSGPTTIRTLNSEEKNTEDADALKEEVNLTIREQEVLRLMAGGYSNREIGELIKTTEGTIKSYVSNILSKLGERDRTRAVLRALEYQLI